MLRGWADAGSTGRWPRRATRRSSRRSSAFRPAWASTRSSPMCRSAGRRRHASIRERKRISRMSCTGKNSGRRRGRAMDSNVLLNQMLYRMEEVFWHELSDCAPWKTEYVGIDFIQSQDIKGATEDEVIRSCIDRIKAVGLAQEVDFSITGNDILLKLQVRDCQLMLKETLLRKGGIKPYSCPLANMIRDQLIEKLGYETTYLADMAADEKTGCCDLKVAIYATPEKIGAVSDWSKA